ncbi:MAG: DUF5602 domain-containing protein [Haloplanus sp.]
METGRRDVLKAAGVLAATGLVASGTAAARRGPATRTGIPTAVGDGNANTYVEYTNGNPSTIGVYLDATALDNLPVNPNTPGNSTEYRLDLPTGNTGRFEFVGLDWNPYGHEPEGVYTNPHFDVYFYMQSASAVDDIAGGVPDYEIPDALMPATTDYSPERAVVPKMGEHLVSDPVSYPTSAAWSVFIWGAYDPDGDGTGQLTFMEPMTTTAYLQNLRGDGSDDARRATTLPMPDRFEKAGWYPTEYVVRYHADGDAFTISLEEFEHFPGYGRR